MAEFVRQYDDFPLGTSDASVLALADRLDITEIATPTAGISQPFACATPSTSPCFPSDWAE